jgi:hypothetical protein
MEHGELAICHRTEINKTVVMVGLPITHLQIQIPRVLGGKETP